MPPYPKTLDPEKALQRNRLTLEQLSQIVAITPNANGYARDIEKISPHRLREEAFFQSPVDKSAWTIPRGGRPGAKRRFVFNASGAVQSERPLVKALLDWLELDPGERTAIDTKTALQKWVRSGIPPKGTPFDKIEEKLRERAVQPELLYNQPICRLVRRDQLRYDPNYQALYQITPAQERLVRMQSEALSGNQDDHDDDSVTRNQRAYWGISETFQSLVALFDSDLGQRKDGPGSKKVPKITKELVRIEVQENGPKRSTTRVLSPAGLNRYSPLRFWSPPPSFASSVFHMLFWRSIITGKDLFRRDVEGETLRKRTESYYVIVNCFNPAKFRIADYPNLFKAILTLARKLAEPGSQTNDLQLPNIGSTRLFYPAYFPDMDPEFKGFDELTLSIPFSANRRSTAWDLALPYNPRKPSDLKRCLLQFLRDRAIELMLWSTYQMEIRSIGLIPIQYLYQINLSNDLRKFFTQMIGLHRKDAAEGTRKNFDQIIRQVSEKLLKSNFTRQVRLQKVYGGPHRDVLQPGLFEKDRKRAGREPIKWLEN